MEVAVSLLETTRATEFVMSPKFMSVRIKEKSIAK